MTFGEIFAKCDCVFLAFAGPWQWWKIVRFPATRGHSVCVRCVRCALPIFHKTKLRPPASPRARQSPAGAAASEPRVVICYCYPRARRTLANPSPPVWSCRRFGPGPPPGNIGNATETETGTARTTTTPSNASFFERLHLSHDVSLSFLPRPTTSAPGVTGVFFPTNGTR